MDILLIRHAESANNASWSGDRDAFFATRHHDPALTERGELQASLLAAHLGAGGEGRIDELASSPMVRAVRTAAPCAAALGLPLQIDVEIFEQGGLFSGDSRTGVGVVGHPGLGRAELERLSPGCALPAAVGEDGWWRGAHEDAVAADARACRFAAALRARAEREPDVRIALVSHGAFLSRVLASLLGASSETTWFHHDNTAISRLELADGQLVVHAQNRIGHLADTPTLGPPMAAI